MTSIISPQAYASQLATDAQTRLAQASNLLRSIRPQPIEPTDPNDGLVRIPEASGPDSPDNPWFIAPKPIMPPYIPNNAAVRLAGGAVTAIERALALGTELSVGVTQAFTRAKDEALAGVRMLQPDPQRPIASGASALQFDAAGMWLGLAKNLLTLDYGRPGVVRPPAQILPVELPIERTPDAEILPVKLPSPDSEIQ